MKKLILIAAASVMLAPMAARAQSVSAGDNFFDPKTVTIDVGDTVTWTNDGNNPHTVTATDDSFDSGTLAKGQTYSRTFDEAGSVEYYCEIHGASMSGTVEVRAAGSSPAPSRTAGTTTRRGSSGGTDVDGNEEMPRAGVGSRAATGAVALMGAAVLIAVLRSRRPEEHDTPLG